MTRRRYAPAVAAPSIMAEVNRERVLLVGGQRALVMQLAHPSVAAGVDQHSDFPARALPRLRRTLDLSLAMIYGSPDEAERAVRAVRAVHDRVRGDAEGAPYRANDPELLQWVNATLVDTTLLVFERFVRPLSAAERGRYYAESVDAAELFGIPRSAIPPDLRSFRRYIRRMLTDGTLRVTGASRRLVGHVLHPSLPLMFRLPTAASRRITVALLPEEIRAMFGLRRRWRNQVTLSVAAATSRVVLPFVPPVLREFTRARTAPAGTMGEWPGRSLPERPSNAGTRSSSSTSASRTNGKRAGSRGPSTSLSSRSSTGEPRASTPTGPW
jgi:uncharacterized protein (DUF2236 family)